MKIFQETADAVTTPPPAFPDGKYYKYCETFGRGFQIMTSDLDHIVFCDTGAMAKALCDALNYSAVFKAGMGRTLASSPSESSGYNWLLEIPLTNAEHEQIKRHDIRTASRPTPSVVH